MVYMTSYVHPEFGELTLGSDGEHLVGLWMAGQKYFGSGMEPEFVRDDDAAPFASARAWLDRYFAGERPSIDELPLALQGGEFRVRVWNKLREIPYGTVRTYGDIARELAREDGREAMSAQAVGGAVGHNPLSIIVPCHRVVGANGSLTGYAGGVARKVWLLEHEGVAMDGLFVPTRGTAL